MLLGYLYKHSTIEERIKELEERLEEAKKGVAIGKEFLTKYNAIVSNEKENDLMVVYFTEPSAFS